MCSPSDCKEGGFTIVELLVVMFAITLIAISSMGFLHRVTDMYRRAETRNRLLEIKKGVLAYYRAKLEERRSGTIDSSCQDFPFPWINNDAVVTDTGTGWVVAAKAGKEVKDWFTKIASFLRATGINYDLDGWNRYWIVRVSFDASESHTVNSNYCTISDATTNTYASNWCPSTAYEAIPKVLIMSAGGNGRIDTELANWWKKEEFVFEGDDIGIIILASEVDAEGDVYTEDVMRDMAAAASSFFSNCIVLEASAAGGVTSTVLQKNYWVTGCNGQRLSSLSDFVNYLRFSPYAIKDFWGNNIQWDPASGASHPPYVGKLRAPCSGKEISVVPSL